MVAASMTMHDGYKVCSAIAGITIIEVVALLTGHNGTVLRLALIFLSGLGGFTVAKIIAKGKP